MGAGAGDGGGPGWAGATALDPHPAPLTEAWQPIPNGSTTAKLSQILAKFERDGINAEPVTFGSHRRPQGVLIGWDLWLEILPVIEDRLDAAEARNRLDRADNEQVSFDDAVKAMGRDRRAYR